MRFVAICLATALVAMGASIPAFAEVELQADQRENLGIRTEPIRVIDAARSWSATAQVLDVAPLVATLSELQSAEAAASASRSEAERAERLYHDDANVARKAADAAHAQATADQGRVSTLRAQLVATWGRAISALTPELRRQLIDDLLKGRTSLVRAEQLYPLPTDTQIAQAQVSALSGNGSWPAQWLGPLSQANGATLAGASLLRVGVGLPPGQLLAATLLEAHPSVRGPSVPAAAIIRWHGSEWVYEETSANHFARREIRPGARFDGRALIEGDVARKGNVVIVGARALLAAEQGSGSADD